MFGVKPIKFYISCPETLRVNATIIMIVYLLYFIVLKFDLLITL